MNRTSKKRPGAPLKIERFWLFVSRDENGDEGVCAMQTFDGWLPMIAADEERLRALLPVAQKIADESGEDIVIAEFGGRRDGRVFRTQCPRRPGETARVLDPPRDGAGGEAGRVDTERGEG